MYVLFMQMSTAINGLIKCLLGSVKLHGRALDIVQNCGRLKDTKGENKIGFQPYQLLCFA